MNKQQLAAKIWESANEMRSKIEANEYKDYILGLMFYKFLSHKELKFLKTKLELEGEELKEELLEENEELRLEIQKSIGYFISYNNLFTTWVELKSEFSVSNVTDALNAFERLIYRGEDSKLLKYIKVYSGIFGTLQSGISKLGENATTQKSSLNKLINLINDIPMDSKQDYDVLGFVYEYLISNFAANAGKKAGEFYTPHEVSLLMSEICAEHLKDRKEIEIYDPTSGSGSLLINIGKTASKYIKEKDKIKYYAQELKQNTYNLTRMNLIMRDIIPENIFVRNGDTLEEDWPYFDEQNQYKALLVDAIVSNPPYSQKWNPTDKELDARYKEYGLAPKAKADYAFLLHDLFHLESDGIMTIVLPHGVLFRGGEEGEIRKNLIENNNIDTIIGLPANIFFGTGIPTIIMVLRKNRQKQDVLIIDASKGFAKEGKNNKLRASDIKKILDTYIARKDVDKYAKVVSREEIRNNDYNLNIPRYVDSSEEEETQDIYALMNGGIPNNELDKLNKYFGEFKNLKNDIFEKLNDSYWKLKDIDLKEVLNNHSDIKNYKNQYNNKFSDFDKYLYNELIEKIDNVDLSSEDVKLTNELFRRLEEINLVDKYDAYQIFSDVWNKVSGDIEIIQSEGIEVCKTLEPIIEIKSGKEKIVGDKGIIIPLEEIIDFKLKDLNEDIKVKNNRVEEINACINEIFENLSEDEKSEISEVFDEEITAFDKKSVTKKAKEFSKQNGELSNAENQVLEVDKLFKEQDNLNKEVKDINLVILNKAKEELKNLSNEDICYLLNKKWITPTIEGIDKQIDDVVNNFIKEIQKLANKYSETLVDIDNEIEKTEKLLCSMFDELTGSEYDMKGLEDLKSLLGGC